MPQNRLKTTFEIDVDDRKLAGLEKTMGRAFNQQLLDVFERSLERIERTMGGIASAVPTATGGSVGGAAGGQQRQQEGALISELRSLREEMAKGNRAQERAAREASSGRSQHLRTMGTMGTTAAIAGLSGNATAGMFQAATPALSAVPLIGPGLGAASAIVSAAMRSVTQLFGEAAGQDRARLGAFGATGFTGSMYGQAERFLGSGTREVAGLGLDPGEVPGMIAQVTQSSGLRGRMTPGVLRTLVESQRLMGLDAASLVGAGGTAGGQNPDDARQMIAEAVSGGVQAGFREGRLPQYFQQIAQFTEAARTRGIPIDVQTTNTLFASMGGIGSAFQGEAGAQFAQSFGSGFQRAGEGGSVFDAIALRTAGLGSGASLQEAREAIESDPTMMARYINRIREMAGGNSNLGAMLMRQATGQFGGDLSAIQSRQLFENGMQLQAPTADAGMDMMRQAYEDYQGQSGIARASAGLALSRQSVGRRHAGTAARIQRHDMQIMSRGLQLMEPVLRRIMDLIDEAFAIADRGPNPGGATAPTPNNVVSQTNAATGGIPQQVFDVIDEVTGGAATAASQSIAAATGGSFDIAASLGTAAYHAQQSANHLQNAAAATAQQGGTPTSVQ